MQIIYLFVPFQTEANFNSFTNYFNNLTIRHGGYLIRLSYTIYCIVELHTLNSIGL